MQIRVLQSGQSGRKLLPLLAYVLLLSILVPTLISAHGGGTPRLTDVAAGPYRLFVWTQPEPLRVGDVHVTIGVTSGGGGAAAPASDRGVQPITDATVTIRVVAIDGDSETLERVAILGGVGTLYYEADASLPTAGVWRFIIEVRGPAGEGTAEFTEEVAAARTVNWSLLAGGVVVFALLIALIGLWNRRQGTLVERVVIITGQ